MKAAHIAAGLALAMAVAHAAESQADTPDTVATYVARIQAAPEIAVSPTFRAALIAAEDRFFDCNPPQRSVLSRLVAAFALPPQADRAEIPDAAARMALNLGAESLLKAIYMDVYLGKSCTGIVAAADGFFGTDPMGLSLAQSVVLVSVLKAPAHFAAEPERHADRAAFVLAELAKTDAGFPPPSDHDIDVALRAYSQSRGCGG